MTLSEIEAHHPTDADRPDIAIDGGAPFRGTAEPETATDTGLAHPAAIIGIMVAVVLVILAVVSR
jgi:hypothetical protein